MDHGGTIALVLLLAASLGATWLWAGQPTMADADSTPPTHRPEEEVPGKRQHLRCIVRDGRAAFVGSQSLRKLELDARREIGVIVKDPKVVRGIAQMFESDWAETDAGKERAREREKESKRERADHEAGEKGESAAAGA